MLDGEKSAHFEPGLWNKLGWPKEPDRRLKLNMSGLPKLLLAMEKYRRMARSEIKADADRFEMTSLGFGGYDRWADMFRAAAAW